MEIDRRPLPVRMLERRNFLKLAAIAAPAAAAGQAIAPAVAQPAHPACLPAWSAIPSRPASKIEVLYKTKHGQPNGLALVEGHPDQMWVLDQGAGHWITLINIRDGSTVREFQADIVGPSGLVQDGEMHVGTYGGSYYTPPPSASSSTSGGSSSGGTDVPEPGMLLLFGAGIAGLVYWRRRRPKAA